MAKGELEKYTYNIKAGDSSGTLDSYSNTGNYHPGQITYHKGKLNHRTRGVRSDTS